MQTRVAVLLVAVLLTGVKIETAFGVCNSAPSTPSATPPTTPQPTAAATPAPTSSASFPESKDSKCGTVAKTRCTAGDSCSQFGWCGSTTAYTFNCQAGYGGLNSPSPCAAATPAATTPAATTPAATAPAATSPAATTPAATTPAATTPAATTPAATTPAATTPAATTPAATTPAATTPAATTPAATTPAATTPAATTPAATTPAATTPAATTPAATTPAATTPAATTPAATTPAATTPAATPNATAAATTPATITKVVTTGPLCSQTYPSVPFGYTDSTGAKTAALTFDDAPDSEGNTDKVLDALKAAGVKATFFVNGNNYCDSSVPPCSTTLARISAEGHDVADHSMSHPHMDTLTGAAINTEFSAMNSLVGKSMTEYRMPFGEPFESVDQCGPGGSPCGAAEVARIARTTSKYGVHVGWTFDAEDFDCGANAACVTKGYSPFYNSGQSGVVLHHSVQAGTPAALPGLMALGKSKGYTFVKSEYYVQQIYGMGSAAVASAFAACHSGNTTTG
ncbi:hypothetical protein ABBQ38_003260 [Trebouxia sp. C0009 RCD-2024]